MLFTPWHFNNAARNHGWQLVLYLSMIRTLAHMLGETELANLRFRVGEDGTFKTDSFSKLVTEPSWTLKQTLSLPIALRTQVS